MVLLDFSSLSIFCSLSVLRGAGHTGYNFYSLVQQALNWHLSWTLGDLTPLHDASVTVVLDNKKSRFRVHLVGRPLIYGDNS